MSHQKIVNLNEFIPRINLHLKTNFYWLFAMEMKTICLCFFYYKRLLKKIKNYNESQRKKRKMENIKKLKKSLSEKKKIKK